MRVWVKFSLFISAYTPLFLIIILKYIDFNFINPCSITIILIYSIPIIISNLIWIIIFKITKEWTKQTFTVKKSVDRTSDALNYVIAYIIAFIGFQFIKWQDWVSFIILLIVICFIYINSNLIFVNPLLNVFGYKIYDIEVEEGGNIILITKKKSIKINEKIKMRFLSDNIYLGEC